MKQRSIPLCVDLDGTLVRTDTLLESLLRLFKQAPLSLPLLPVWLLRGRAYFKRQLAARIRLDAATLPYHAEFLAWLREEHGRQRELVLCTAADQEIAQAVARHTGLFSRVLSSDGAENLKSERKRAKLVELFGERGYDYAGDAAADLPVWRSARRAVIVGADGTTRARAARIAEIERSFDAAGGRLLLWFKALRLHQWVKNLLIFLPVLLAHRLDAQAMSQALAAFFAFSLCASSVYLLNDLLDLDSDRAHPRKHSRPFASGALPLSQGMIASPLLLAAGFALAAVLPLRFVLVLAFYYAVTLAYSMVLKRIATVDVMLLAGLYTLRIIAGGAATGVVLSFWLLAFSMFIFLSLGIIKRYTELDLLKDGGGVAAGRGYVADDLPLLRSLGVAAGYGAVVVLALYINSPQSQAEYTHPKWLWLLCPLLLYWISRAWMYTHRGRMHDDPVVFALSDGVSLVIAALMALTIAAAAA